jgi:hypothetical protein
VFKIIGFDVMDDEILKSLVTARISQPLSKVATVDYLKSHFDKRGYNKFLTLTLIFRHSHNSLFDSTLQNLRHHFG